MSFGRTRGGHGLGGGGGHGDDLMITPLLDLFVALIPFLIFSAVMTKINILDVGISKPVASATPQKNQKPFDLVLRINDATVEVLLNGKVVKSTPRVAEDKTWVEQARKALVDIKKQNPDEFKLRIEPKGKVQLHTLIDVMDAVRKLRADDGEILHKDEAGKTVKLQFLFPNIILRGVYG